MEPGHGHIANAVQVTPASAFPIRRRPSPPTAKSFPTTAERSSPWAATRTTQSAHPRRLTRRVRQHDHVDGRPGLEHGGPTPTGTVTFTYYDGANNPLNYDTTPVTIGTATVDNGVATVSLSASQSAAVLLAAHYHVMPTTAAIPITLPAWRLSCCRYSKRPPQASRRRPIRWLLAMVSP